MLGVFVAAARATLDADLVSVVLFGSAAENKLGPTSDVNLKPSDGLRGETQVIAPAPKPSRLAHELLSLQARPWLSMIFSENRYPPRIKCGAGIFGIML
jgi:hypothetical protein